MRVVVAFVCAFVSVRGAGASVCFTSAGHAICGDTLERCESLRTRELSRFGGTGLPACADSAIVVTAIPANGKDPGVALGLSLGTTVIGLGVLFAATTYAKPGQGSGLAIGGAGVLLFGPSTGHFYADRPASIGLAIRAAGLAIVSVGLWCASGGEDGPNRCSSSLSGSSLFVGAIATAVGTIADLATAGDAARAYNRALGLDAAITPTAIRTATGTVPGLGLVGRF